jgi:hypothetical protein
VLYARAGARPRARGFLMVANRVMVKRRNTTRSSPGHRFHPSALTAPSVELDGTTGRGAESCARIKKLWRPFGRPFNENSKDVSSNLSQRPLG